jgi:hypothetical protein
MADYINKESWCTNEYHDDKFHYKNIILKKCLKCDNCNPNFINNNKNCLFNTNKNLKKLKRSSNLNYKYFIKVSNNTDY